VRWRVDGRLAGGELGGLESEVRRVRGGLKVVRLSEVDGL